jgi:hypothetical protein
MQGEFRTRHHADVELRRYWAEVLLHQRAPTSPLPLSSNQRRSSLHKLFNQLPGGEAKPAPISSPSESTRSSASRVRRKAAATALRAPRPEWVDVCLSPDSGGIADIPQPPLGSQERTSTAVRHRVSRRGRDEVPKSVIACRRSAARGQTRRSRGISVIPVFMLRATPGSRTPRPIQANFIRELFHAVASAEPALLVVKRGHTREPHVRVAQLAEMPHARHQRQPCARADVLLQM